MARSRIGPLAMEAPLGGPESKVFRAIHVQQKAQLAVRVFSVPMGMTPEAKREFAEQMEDLKTLRHPGIVRCYGGGFDQRDAYLVYELVDGESLESLLNRRQRLPWESVLDYGQQMCEALDTAHQLGWVHGRLRPDKLLVSRDANTIKITDFRRKEQASNMLIAPATVKQLAYASPESLSGGVMNEAAEISSDLYSLGAVLYHMLTGAPPFQAGNPSLIKAAILDQQPAPVATQVFDCPVWLNSIVEQLLDKHPAKRPYSAQALSLALREAERRASQGIGVAQHAVSGFSPLQMKSADRVEAEKLLGTKPKTERKNQDGPPFHEHPIFLVGCLLVALAAIAWFFMPPGEKAIRARAEALLASDEPSDWNDAQQRYLTVLVDKYPESDNASWAQEQIQTVELKLEEKRLERMARLNRAPENEAERRFLDAQKFQRFGDRATAFYKYNALVELFRKKEEHRAIVNLAMRQSESLGGKAFAPDEVEKFLTEKLAEVDRLRKAGDILAAQSVCENIASLYQNMEQFADIVQKAEQKHEELKKL